MLEALAKENPVYKKCKGLDNLLRRIKTSDELAGYFKIREANAIAKVTTFDVPTLDCFHSQYVGRGEAFHEQKADSSGLRSSNDLFAEPITKCSDAGSGLGLGRTENGQDIFYAEV